MSGRLANRVVVVTGARQGIGKVFALGLAAECAKLVLCDVTDPADVVEQIEREGGEAISREADVTSPAALGELVAAAKERFGAIHGLVNNAAIFSGLARKPFEQITSEEWDRVMAVNARGPFECVKAVLPLMRGQQYGKIVNIASGTVFKGTTGMLHYVTSKGAVATMTRVLARELGPDKIGVNTIAPGFTESEMIPPTEIAHVGPPTVASRCFQRSEVPEDLVGALIFLCSAESDFITGQTLCVDGGSVLH